MSTERAFQMAASNIRFGAGSRREAAHDLKDLGVKRPLVVTDRHLRSLPAVEAVLEALNEESVAYTVYDEVRIEPTDGSFRHAAEFAREGQFDGFIAVGGGSVIDTAKAANLYSTYPPEDFFDYVNPPLGRGLPPPGNLKPLIAIPTTAGTGSETTGVAIFDYESQHVKTGIAHRLLKPLLGILDPETTRTLPPQVAAASGLDVLCHAIESYTAISWQTRPLAARPSLRPAYQGSNPISDVWSLEAMRLAAFYLPQAVEDPSNDYAREQMLLASAYAGIGFGNGGVHLPHAMSYPVAGMAKGYYPEGYRSDHPLIPHGVSVILSAPAVFRFTAPSNPQRHLRAAESFGVNIRNVRERDAGAALADAITRLMQRLTIPNGLKAVGYGAEHIPALIEGTMAQQRLTKLSPRAVGPEELARLFEESMTAW